MTLFDKCPLCGESLVEKEVEKILRGGTNTAVVRVKAEVCLHCGERLYSEEDIKKFADIRKKLANKDTDGFTHIGQAFAV